jgi:hypothetical protein
MIAAYLPSSGADAPLDEARHLGDRAPVARSGFGVATSGRVFPKDVTASSRDRLMPCVSRKHGRLRPAKAQRAGCRHPIRRGRYGRRRGTGPRGTAGSSWPAGAGSPAPGIEHALSKSKLIMVGHFGLEARVERHMTSPAPSWTRRVVHRGVAEGALVELRPRFVAFQLERPRHPRRPTRPSAEVAARRPFLMCVRICLTPSRSRRTR